jgi:mutual gliding-motility protein MglA
MPLIDQANQTIRFKIAYYGPAAAGKASSLRHLHSLLGNTAKSQLESSSNGELHTVSLRCTVPRNTVLPGYSLHLHLTTTSGSVLDKGLQMVDLQDADGIVFVADSQYLKLQVNIQELRGMAQGLRQFARPVRHLPIVLQYNKRDLPLEVLTPVTVMDAYLNPVPWPRLLTVAWHYPGFGGSWNTGDGVMETLQMLVMRMVAQVRSRMNSNW